MSNPNTSLTSEDKIDQNRFILGMAEFSIGIIFNTTTFIAVIVTGLVKQSTGLYLLCLMLADTLNLITVVLMEEFLNPLIDVDVFGDVGDPMKLCQAIYFLREMSYYWRWFLMAMLVIDRCILVSGAAGMGRLRIVAIIMSVILFLVSGGLAAYWIYFVDDNIFGSVGGVYSRGMCEIKLVTGGDTTSVWFFMDTIVHVILPNLVLPLVVLISGIALACRLRGGKPAESLGQDDVNLSQSLVALAFVNFLIMLPHICVNGFILNLNKAFDTYNFSDNLENNLRYAGLIFRKCPALAECITFFVLLFARQFRTCCCKY